MHNISTYWFHKYCLLIILYDLINCFVSVHFCFSLMKHYYLHFMASSPLSLILSFFFSIRSFLVLFPSFEIYYFICIASHQTMNAVGLMAIRDENILELSCLPSDKIVPFLLFWVKNYQTFFFLQIILNLFNSTCQSLFLLFSFSDMNDLMID